MPACSAGAISLPSPPVKSPTYPAPQDAEAAFYDALERGDLDGMMGVWAEDEEIVCIHPGGPRLTGYDQVRASWAQIFKSRQKMQVQVSHQVLMQGMMLAIHSVHENILVAGEAKPRAPVVATNIYLRTSSGWRMLVHHASPAPAGAGASVSESPKVLH
jgi:ketosteroid isomerase-like protein